MSAHVYAAGELRGRLQYGTAEKRIIFYADAYYAQPNRLTDRVLDEWWLGIDPTDEDFGTYAEFSIRWVDLNGPTWRLDVFGDGVAGVIATDLLPLLARHHSAAPDELRQALLDNGWIDRTPRESPWKRNDDRLAQAQRLREQADELERLANL